MLRRIALLILVCGAASANAQQIAQIAPSTNQGFIPESFWVVPSYYANLASGVTPPWLSHTWGAAPTSPAYYFDASGNLQASPNNQIANSTASGAVVGTPGTLPPIWGVVGGCAGFAINVVATGVTNGMPTVDLQFVNASTTDTFCVFRFNPGVTTAIGQTYIESTYAALVGGTLANVTGPNIDNRMNGNSCDTTMSLSGTLVRQNGMACTGTGAGISTPAISIGYSSGVAINFTLRLAGPQWEQVTAGQTTPSAFMPTSGSAYYGPVANDHLAASPFTALGLRTEPQRVNLFLNNTVPATQTVTVANATQYTVSFYGTGTEVLTGACTTTMTGAAGVRTSYTCTTATTSLVMTATSLGATAYPQVETGPFATSPILTYATAVTVPADNWSFTGAALAQLKSGAACLVVEAQSEGTSTNFATVAEINDGTYNNRVQFGNPANNSAYNSLNYVVALSANKGGFSLIGGSTVTAPRRFAVSYGPSAASWGYDGTVPQVATPGLPLGLTTALLGRSNLSATIAWSGWDSKILVKPSCTAAQVQTYSTANADMSH